MTVLTVYRADGGGIARGPTTDIAAIIHALKAIDIHLERKPIFNLPKAADGKAVLEIYAEEVEALNRQYGFKSFDAIRMNPASPGAAELRRKFLCEHTHNDDEVRFFVEGSGSFYIRKDDLVYQIICTAGDLISVPDGTKHWFDTGPSPRFAVIRFFTKPNGWAADYTGDDVATRVPTYEQMVA